MNASELAESAPVISIQETASKTAGKPKRVFVRVEGIQEESNHLKSVVDKEIEVETKKLGKILHVERMIVVIKPHSITGKRRNYSVRARIMTEKGTFFANSNAWDITKAVRDVLNKLEIEILRRVGKRRTRNRSV